MAVWQRAIVYLSRKRGRTLFLIIFIFVMSVFILVGAALMGNANNEITTLRKKFATGFVLKADTKNEIYLKQMEGNGFSYVGYTGPKVTEELIEEILEIEGVVNYSVDSLVDLVWTGLKVRPGRWENDEPSEVASAEELEVLRQLTRIWPCRVGELHTNFRTGALEISDGRNIQKGDHFNAVISEWLAKKNNLSVGDTFVVETKEGAFQPSSNPMKTWGEPVELEIVGIFHMNFKQVSSEYTSPDEYMENIIYTDLDTHDVLEQNLYANRSGKEEGYLEVTFLVDDPEKLDAILQQAEALEQAEGLLISPDDTAYKAMAKPYGQIRTFALLLVGVGIAGAVMILYLLMRLWVRGRIHEAGILLSLGIGKRKIVAQMLVECLTVTTIGLTMSIVLSGGTVRMCTELARQITAPKENQESYKVEVDYSEGPSVTKVSADEVTLNHRVSMETIAFTVLLVCGISSVSVLLASVKITDIEPKKLLRSM